MSNAINSLYNVTQLCNYNIQLTWKVFTSESLLHHADLFNDIWDDVFIKSTRYRVSAQACGNNAKVVKWCNTQWHLNRLTTKLLHLHICKHTSSFFLCCMFFHVPNMPNVKWNLFQSSAAILAQCPTDTTNNLHKLRARWLQLCRIQLKTSVF